MKSVIKNRVVNESVKATLLAGKAHPFLAKLIASRGAKSISDYTLSHADLLPYTDLKNAVEMAEILADAIVAKKKILIVSDYDADGATACCVAYSALKAFGADVHYLIPKRLTQGYGLTLDIAQVACSEQYKPDYLITVDNGISSFEGIEYCQGQGVDVLVTDHHAAPATLPRAKIIVNPNQPACKFPSKALAGVGVIYYVMWALEDVLLERDIQKYQPHFEVQQLLPFVAVGTIADVVSLDTNNRILVKSGMERIWKGKCSEGLKALIKGANKRITALTTSDVAFQIGPRINAVGRLETMDIGVDCLLCEHPGKAVELASNLQAKNEERKNVELEAVDAAMLTINEELDPAGDYSIVVSRGAEWHQGVVGIVAGRIKEKFWRPTFVFTAHECKDNEMKGSGRSIPGLNLRDALVEVDTMAPGILLKFGGHAMAAGATIAADRLSEFQKKFEEVVRKHLSEDQLHQIIEVDGPVPNDFLNIGDISHIKEFPWGQNFPEPMFEDRFSIKSQRLIGEGKHLKLDLIKDGCVYSAVMFRQPALIDSSEINLVYKLDVNEFRGQSSVQILVEKIIDS